MKGFIITMEGNKYASPQLQQQRPKKETKQPRQFSRAVRRGRAVYLYSSATSPPAAVKSSLILLASSLLMFALITCGASSTSFLAWRERAKDGKDGVREWLWAHNGLSHSPFTYLSQLEIGQDVADLLDDLDLGLFVKLDQLDGELGLLLRRRRRRRSCRRGLGGMNGR